MTALVTTSQCRRGNPVDWKSRRAASDLFYKQGTRCSTAHFLSTVPGQAQNDNATLRFAHPAGIAKLGRRDVAPE